MVRLLWKMFSINILHSMTKFTSGAVDVTTSDAPVLPTPSHVMLTTYNMTSAKAAAARC
jgi:hypothetical protein